MQSLDPLSIPACEASKPANHAFPYTYPFPKGMFNGNSFFEHLKERQHPLWIMTYSFHPKAIEGLNIKRLLLEASITGLTPVGRLKLIEGIHTKLYLEVSGSRVIQAYMGSMNLSYTRKSNLMVQLDKKYHDFCKDYFLHYWEQA